MHLGGVKVTTEDVAELVRIKTELEKQLQDRKSEVAALQKRIRSISGVLRQLSVQPGYSAPPDKLGPLRTVVRDRWGNPIANIDVELESIRITPTGSTPIDTRKAPFRNFLLHRVLRAMRDQDKQAVMQGKLSHEDAIAFECRENEGMLVELAVHHYRTSQRLERIKDALNWTLEKQQLKRLHPT